MSVYKEGYYALSKIEKFTKRIHSDGCDYGAPVKKGDPLWNLVKQLVDWYRVKEKSTRHIDEYVLGGTTVSEEVELMIEGDYRQGTIERFRVTYVTFQTRDMDGYVYVDKIKIK